MRLAFRPAAGRGSEDRRFIVSTWSSSYKKSHSAGVIHTDDWATMMHPQFERHLDRLDARAVIVYEKSDPGFSFGEKERKLGIKGSPTRELHFEDCRISGDRMVGSPGEGLKIALRTLDHTRVTIGAQAVGIAQGALDVALDYVKDRRQFGSRIADFQGIQFMLADMAMELEAARAMVYVAAAKSERGDKDLPFFGAAAKCYASDAAMTITTDAVQLLGGAGYTQDFPLERMMRDAKITQIYEGTNQVQRIVIARQLLA